MKVKDIKTRTNSINLRQITYGYCKCGREVTKGKYLRCPLCNAYLEWSEEDETKREWDNEQKYSLLDEVVVKLLNNGTIVYENRTLTIYSLKGIKYGVVSDKNDNVLNIFTI